MGKLALSQRAAQLLSDDVDALVVSVQILIATSLLYYISSIVHTHSLHNNNNNNMAEDKAEDPLLKLGVIDSTCLKNDVWLIRIPTKLAAIWKDAPEGTDLGELIFKKGGKVNNNNNKSAAAVVKPSLTVECNESLVQSKNDTPLHYTMEAMTKKVPNLYPFTRHPDGTVQLAGTVSRSANLQASRHDPRYRQLSKNRLLDTSVHNTRFVRPVEATELSVRKSAMGNNKGFGSAVMAFGQRNKEDGSSLESNNRKRKYVDIPTRSVVFELFSLQPYWTVKELKNESGKPEKELRVVLNEIGDYHRSGEHKNMWALKPEYQTANK